MVEQYGVGGGGSAVPMGALDFALENVGNPAEEARKLALTCRQIGLTSPKPLIKGEIKSVFFC